MNDRGSWKDPTTSTPRVAGAVLAKYEDGVQEVVYWNKGFYRMDQNGGIAINMNGIYDTDGEDMPAYQNSAYGSGYAAGSWVSAENYRHKRVVGWMELPG